MGFFSSLGGNRAPENYTAAVILAAGRSERFGKELGKKQFHMIAGVPSLVHTLRAFETCRAIHEIVIVASPEDAAQCEALAREYGITKFRCVVAGGEDRQASAKRGFDAITPEAQFVAIHDGARCLVTPEIIEATVRAAIEVGAAVAAEPSRDSVKTVDESGFVKESQDRRRVWLAKTPQVFLADLYRAAIYTAERDNYRATDDSALAERIGFRVKAVDCGHENLKLTYPVDAAIAETILAARAKEPKPAAEATE